MNAHNKRKFALFLQILGTVIIFMSLNKFIKGRDNFIYLIVGIVIFIGVMYYRYRVLTKYFYVQRFKKSKGLETVSRLLPIAAFIAVFYITDKYGLNTLVGATLFSLNTIIDERYTKYFTQEEYNEYMKNKKTNKKK